MIWIVVYVVSFMIVWSVAFNFLSKGTFVSDAEDKAICAVLAALLAAMNPIVIALAILSGSSYLLWRIIKHYTYPVIKEIIRGIKEGNENS